MARSASSYETSKPKTDYDRMGQSFASAIPPVQLVINLDGKKIGQGTAKYVSDAIANKATVKMRSGVLVNV